MKNIEIWKPVFGYEGKYEVSNFGRIKSLQRKRIGKGGGIYCVKEKILNVRNAKYKQVALCFDSVKKYKLIHRLVAQAFIPNPENKPQVNHIDGMPENNRVDNLEWCTPSENQKHAYRAGLQKHQYGEARFNSKLKEKDVAEIKHAIANGSRICDLAKKYGVNSTTITDIKKNRTWRRVKI